MKVNSFTTDNIGFSLVSLQLHNSMLLNSSGDSLNWGFYKLPLQISVDFLINNYN